MRAFVDTIETKEQAIANMQAHYDAGHIDEIAVRGGVVVGLQYGRYYAYINDSVDDIYVQAERVHGIPFALNMLEDEIFEGLSANEAPKWPMQYLRAINVGSDLSQVTDKFILRILEDKERGMISFVQSNSAAIAEINCIVKLYRRRLEGEDVKQGEWSESTSGFRAVAWAKAYAAASCVADVAAAYANSTAVNIHDKADILVYAAYTKSTALEWEVKRQKHYLWMRDVLLDILKNTKNSED